MTHPLRLHLGCNEVRIPGFLGVDIRDTKATDIVDDVATLGKFGNETVDMIYASHVLEHFGRHEYRGVLATWFRVLRPGGLLRVAVPDFGAVVDHYLENDRSLDNNLLTGLLHGGQRNEFDYHKIIFDRAKLTAELELAGFDDVTPWDWRTTDHADIDDASQAYLPHMDKENGRHMSLNLEATKPSTRGLTTHPK
jgi:predicted SAM-dependent methyltransferase